MSDDNKTLPLAILSFAAGAFVGAVVALLYAPKSGEELRAQIRSETDAAAKRASVEWKKAVQEVQRQVEEGQSQMKAYMAQMQSQIKGGAPAAEEEAEATTE
jgi:gas vesicle protein